MSANELNKEPLPQGLYERVIDLQLQKQLANLDGKTRVEKEKLDPGDSYAILAQHLAGIIAHSLAGFSGEDSLEKQIALSNQIVALLAQQAPESVTSEDQLLQDAKRLLAVQQPETLLEANPPIRPETPLASSCLLTGTRQDPSLVSQLRKELRTADQADILCSFIKWSGIRVLKEEFEFFTHKPNARLRIITTSYMGATDFKAVEFLSELPNTELRVSYDTRRTRLHAKAYLFHRATQFGTAYVGSSNLSNAALTDGLEWNVKISQYESDHLWQKVCATFDTYWNDPEFIAFTAAEHSHLQRALQNERTSTGDIETPFPFDIHPYPYQQEILDRLAADRAYHNRTHNLVVAATGTGKTVIAAFDYKRVQAELARRRPGQPVRLLFVAHREEILKQSLACFRGVLHDQNFGDLWVGPYRPTSLDHLFISIQSYNAQGLAEKIAPDFFDFIVVDEFHHAEAVSYQRLLAHIKPKILLGLTATPERADGLDILQHFGGHISAEIRLPDAINRKLLCPFQYFGLTDSTDLSQLTWRGGYLPQELEHAYTLNGDTRARDVVQALRDKLLDPRQARGLGFCITVKHARYMAEYFTRCGIPSEALSAETPHDQRQAVQRKLVAREINFIFVVDLYNEGVDIPEIDTLLLLRPTESLTVFLQQLGRGLRLHEEKECLTVLDFIGQAHRNYNFEMRFRALMDRPKQRVDREIAEGCPHVPLGCVIHLERIAQRYVLENIRGALYNNQQSLLHRIASFESDTGRKLTLANFADYYEMDLDDIYRRGSWSRLRARAGRKAAFADPDEEILSKGLRRLAHIDSADWIKTLLTLLRSNNQGFAALLHKAPNTERMLLMLHFTLWGKWCPSTIEESIQRLQKNPTLFKELLGLLEYRFDKIATVVPKVELPFPCPLQLHAAYTRDEILAALGCSTLTGQKEVREGVLPLSDLQTDVFFITLNKTERDYSPTTLYHDYAISDTLFHWQSQSTTSVTSETGQRYIHQQERGNTVLLFVREDKKRNGIACPYVYLGPATYQSHTGSKPIDIDWQLQYPLPASLIPVAKRMAVA